MGIIYSNGVYYSGPKGEKGEKGDSGESITSVSVDSQGRIVFTLESGGSLTTDPVPNLRWTKYS